MRLLSPQQRKALAQFLDRHGEHAFEQVSPAGGPRPIANGTGLASLPNPLPLPVAFHAFPARNEALRDVTVRAGFAGEVMPQAGSLGIFAGFNFGCHAAARRSGRLR